MKRFLPRRRLRTESFMCGRKTRCIVLKGAGRKRVPLFAEFKFGQGRVWQNAAVALCRHGELKIAIGASGAVAAMFVQSDKVYTQFGKTLGIDSRDLTNGFKTGFLGRQSLAHV